MFIQWLWSIGTRALYALFRRPSTLKRGGNPVTWAIPRLLAEWRYESTGTDEPSFVAAVTGSSMEQVNAIYEWVNASLGSLVKKRKRVLYVLVRLFHPDTVVETGVGESTVAILQALQDNGHEGRLFSVDLPTTEERLADGTVYSASSPEVRSGVPEDLRDRWHLILGDAKNVLPDLLSKISKIDIFLHDSLHTEEHMMFEYQTAWPHLKKGGLLLSHDISVSFLRFTQMHGRQFYCTNVQRNRYGAIVK